MNIYSKLISIIKTRSSLKFKKKDLTRLIKTLISDEYKEFYSVVTGDDLLFRVYFKKHDGSEFLLMKIDLLKEIIIYTYGENPFGDFLLVKWLCKLLIKRKSRSKDLERLEELENDKRRN